jgi:phage tail-like protein
MRRDTQIRLGVIGEPPETASARAYLRRSLPAVYAETPPGTSGEAFVMRFLAGLERVLDPIVATIDLLPAQLDLSLASREVIALTAEWLGIELDSALPIEAHRRLVRNATEITRTRGTLPGVELVLDLSFRGLDFTVSDGGGATASRDPRSAHPAGERKLTVSCTRPVSPDDLAAIRRVVEEVAPAGVELELAIEERGT